VLSDVRRQWHVESTAYLTGWEAGGHTVWALTFRHPERWRGVAPVNTNYQRRGLAPAAFSSATERLHLPLQVLREGASSASADAMKALEQQTANALADARAHGFAPAPVRVVPDADHGPLAPSVLAWWTRYGAAGGRDEFRTHPCPSRTPRCQWLSPIARPTIARIEPMSRPAPKPPMKLLPSWCFF
jgi:hypothetical protein